MLFLSHGVEVSGLKAIVTTAYTERLRGRLQALFAGPVYKRSLRARDQRVAGARRGVFPADHAVRALLNCGPLLDGRLRVERRSDGSDGLMAVEWLPVRRPRGPLSHLSDPPWDVRFQVVEVSSFFFAAFDEFFEVVHFRFLKNQIHDVHILHVVCAHLT